MWPDVLATVQGDGVDGQVAGAEIARPEPVTETPVIDLMEALRRSVADAQEAKHKPAAKKTKASSSGTGSRRKTPARKSA